MHDLQMERDREKAIFLQQLRSVANRARPRGDFSAEPPPPPSYLSIMQFFVINRVSQQDRLSWFTQNWFRAGGNIEHLHVHAAVDWRDMNLQWAVENCHVTAEVHHAILGSQHPGVAGSTRWAAIWQSHVGLWKHIASLPHDVPVMIFEDDTLVEENFFQAVMPYVDSFGRSKKFDIGYFRVHHFSIAI